MGTGASLSERLDAIQVRLSEMKKEMKGANLVTHFPSIHRGHRAKMAELLDETLVINKEIVVKLEEVSIEVGKNRAALADHILKGHK